MPARLTASERIRIAVLKEMRMRVADISRELNVHVNDSQLGSHVVCTAAAIGSMSFTATLHSAKEIKRSTPSTDKSRKWEVVWKNVIIISLIHIAFVYATYLSVTKAIWMTPVFAILYGDTGALGITAGAHRLWCHRSYKARWPLRVLLMLLNCVAIQDSILHWARDHRTHHKYSETDADPYNASRGFFFSHVGWLMMKKHADTKEKGRTIDISDLWADPVLRFQKKYYLPLIIVMGVIIPTYIPTLWGETLWNSFFIGTLFRYVLSLNFTWSVNSFAHMWGNKPYDKNINPVENRLVSFVGLGEGFHNYHHTFPWDYKTSELGHYFLNITTLFIDAMAIVGWAYDLKTVPPKMIEERRKRTGDSAISHTGSENNNVFE